MKLNAKGEWLILLGAILLGVLGCKYPNDNKPIILKNFTAEIIKINANSIGISDDKFHRTEACNIVLFKVLNSDPDKYFELNSCKDDYRSFNINSAWIYNHQVGDTCHFDKLSEERLFTISSKYQGNLK
jgi:hypothetical protein